MFDHYVIKNEFKILFAFFDIKWQIDVKFLRKMFSYDMCVKLLW